MVTAFFRDGMGGRRKKFCSIRSVGLAAKRWARGPIASTWRGGFVGERCIQISSGLYISFMAMTMRWVGDEGLDRVAETRLRSYAPAARDLQSCKERVRADARQKPGDFLLAEEQGRPVGTSTSLSLWMWIRGARVSCQGVAWVGTVRTHRRGSKGEGGGIASRLMRETLRLGRERGQVVSALMPFRASFYEHFGYGVVENRSDWTVPLSALPQGGFEGLRYYEPADLPELSKCRQRLVERGQCDIERAEVFWPSVIQRAEDGFLVVDRPDDGGRVRGFLSFQQSAQNGKDYLRVTEIQYEDSEALRRQLHFLQSQRDQFHGALLTLPVDLPLNRLLRETQIPHRLVNHATAEVRPFTRMQLRVLDHKRLLEAMRWPSGARGRAVIWVHEAEGDISRFVLDVSQAQASVAPTQESASFACSDRTWAAVVCGDLRASQALELGMATAADAGVAGVLDLLAEGPRPFCDEYF